MAKGARYAGIAAPGVAFINLLNGSRSVPTGGTPTTSIQGSIGQSILHNSSSIYNNVPNTYSESPAAITIAVIFVPAAAFSGHNFLFSTVSGSVTGTTVGFLSGQPEIYNNSSDHVFSSIPALSVGVPYFIVYSLGNIGQNVIVLNLYSGNIKTQSLANTVPGTPGSTWSIGYNGDSDNAYISAVAYSVNGLSLIQILNWAKSPWDYWFPPSSIYPPNFRLRNIPNNKAFAFTLPLGFM